MVQMAKTSGSYPSDDLFLVSLKDPSLMLICSAVL